VKNLRVKYSTSLSFEVLESTVPPGYRRAANGDEKVPGTYGEGFGGEPLVVLLDGDDGAWFDKLEAP
jgi:hypothetical protein